MGPNFYAAYINFLLNYIHWHLSLFKSVFIFLLISISNPAACIAKINLFKKSSFFYIILFFIPTGQQRFAVIGDSSRAGSY